MCLRKSSASILLLSALLAGLVPLADAHTNDALYITQLPYLGDGISVPNLSPADQVLWHSWNGNTNWFSRRIYYSDLMADLFVHHSDFFTIWDFGTTNPRVRIKYIETNDLARLHNETNAVETYLGTKYRLAVQGHSRSVILQTPWQNWLTNMYLKRCSKLITNTLVASYANYCATNYTNAIQPFKTASGTNLLHCIWTGINDVWNSRAQTTNAWVAISNTVIYSKRDGNLVLVLTEPSATIDEEDVIQDWSRRWLNRKIKMMPEIDWVVDLEGKIGPDDYWDGAHPTTNAHAIIAGLVADTLTKPPHTALSPEMRLSLRNNLYPSFALSTNNYGITFPDDFSSDHMGEIFWDGLRGTACGRWILNTGVGLVYAPMYPVGNNYPMVDQPRDVFWQKTNSLAGTNYFIDPYFSCQAVNLAGPPAQLGITNVNYPGRNMTTLVWLYNNTATNNYWRLATNGFLVSEGQACGPFTNAPGTRTLLTLCLGPHGTNLAASVLQNFR